MRITIIPTFVGNKSDEFPFRIKQFFFCGKFLSHEKIVQKKQHRREQYNRNGTDGRLGGIIGGVHLEKVFVGITRDRVD